MTSFRNFFILSSLILATLGLMQLAACGPGNSETGTQVPKRSIHEAAFMGDLDLMQAHIEAGSDLNQKDDFGSTPLIIAITFDQSAVAKQLIEAGADLNATGADGGTALHSAAFYCRTDLVQALLDKGAELNIRNQYGSTALASVEGPFEQVKMVYDQVSKDLGPLGFKLDYAHLQATRPQVADMIRQAQ